MRIYQTKPSNDNELLLKNYITILKYRYGDMFTYQENDLVIQVTDNGVGIAEDQVSSILDDHSFADNKEMSYKKIGLKNINKRLKLECGEAYGLQISSQPGKYTKITVRYPISRHQEI